MHAVLEYTYGDDYLEAREAHRSAHLVAARAAVDRGELLLGGPAGDGPFTALPIFTGTDALQKARDFAAVDPYVTGGVVTSWTARPWRTLDAGVSLGSTQGQQLLKGLEITRNKKAVGLIRTGGSTVVLAIMRM
jgi:uncharacterized protein YciI